MNLKDWCWVQTWELNKKKNLGQFPVSGFGSERDDDVIIHYEKEDKQIQLQSC